MTDLAHKKFEFQPPNIFGMEAINKLAEDFMFHVNNSRAPKEIETQLNLKDIGSHPREIKKKKIALSHFQHQALIDLGLHYTKIKAIHVQ